MWILLVLPIVSALPWVQWHTVDETCPMSSKLNSIQYQVQEEERQTYPWIIPYPVVSTPGVYRAYEFGTVHTLCVHSVQHHFETALF